MMSRNSDVPAGQLDERRQWVRRAVLRTEGTDQAAQQERTLPLVDIAASKELATGVASLIGGCNRPAPATASAGWTRSARDA